MPAIDIASDIDAAIRTALSSTSIGGKFLTADERGQLRSLIWRAVGEWPQLHLSVTVDVAQRAPMVFAMNSTAYTSATVNAPVPGNATAVLSLIHQNLAPSAAKMYQLETSIRSALMGGWPKLGIQYVTGFSMTERRRDETSPRTKNESRAVTEITLSLTLRPMLSQLTG